MDHPIFEQKMPRKIYKIDLEGLNKHFIQSLNMIYSRIKCSKCGDGAKLTSSHYNYHYGQITQSTFKEEIDKTFKKTEEIWAIKKKIQRLQCKAKGGRITLDEEKQILEFRKLKGNICEDLEKLWKEMFERIKLIL